MLWSFSFYVPLAFCSAIVMLITVALAWRRRSEVPGATYFALGAFAGAWWAYFYALELAAVQPDMIQLFTKLKSIGAAFLPVFWLLFSLLYTGLKERIHFLAVLAVSLPVIGLLVLFFTNDAHHLVWRSASPETYNSLTVLRYAYGTGFWLLLAYDYALLTLAGAVMLHFYWRARFPLYRRQAVALLVGSLLPWVGNVCYFIGGFPYPLDPAPIFLMFGGWLIGWGLPHHRLMRLVPVARAKMLDSMRDAALAINLRGEIINLNAAARAILALPEAQVIGARLSDVLPDVARLLEGMSADASLVESLEVARGRERRWYEAHIVPLRGASQQVVGRMITLHDITERRALEVSLEHQITRYRHVLRIVRAATERLSLEATLRNIMDVTVSLTGANLGSVILTDREQVISRSVLDTGNVRIVQRSLTDLVVDKGLAGWVLRHRRVAIVDDAHSDERWLTLPNQRYEVGSALGVPIELEGEVVGVLVLAHPEPRHFTDDDVEVITAAAQQMALAIRNARAYEAQRRAVRRQIVLYESLRSLQNIPDPKEIAASAAEIIARLTGWAAVAVLVPCEEEFFCVEGAAGRLAPPLDWRLPNREDVAVAVRELKLHYIPDLREGSSLPLSEEVASAMLVPVSLGEAGTWLLLAASDEIKAFDREARLLAESLAEVIAVTVRNAYLYVEVQQELAERRRAERKLRRALARTTALYHVSQAMVGVTDLGERIRHVVESTAEALRATYIFLAVVDWENERMLHVVGNRPDEIPCLRSDFHALMRRMPGWVMRAQETRLFTPTTDVKHLLAELELEEVPGCPLRRGASAIMAPLVFRDHPPYGVLIAINTEGERVLTEDDLDLVKSIAAQIAVMVHESRLFHQMTVQRSHLQAVVHSSRDGLLLISDELVLLVANGRAWEYLGMPDTPERWQGRTLWELLPILRRLVPQVARVFVREARRIRKGDASPAEGEFQVGQRILRWSNLPIAGEQAGRGRLIVLQDVTEARRVEKLREDLTHAMVHDLRNPLTGIHGALQLLDAGAGKLSPPLQRMLHVARNSADQMLGMVNAILEISMLESGEVPLTLTVFNLRELVNEVLVQEWPVAARRKITLRTDIPEDYPPLRGDRGLIMRVLQNLVGNAIKFTPEGGEVHVFVSADPNFPDKALISVRDTGPGIPAELRDRLFQKFARSKALRGHGSGLGLAFCKLVMDAHGEWIWVADTSEKGTTFTFSLPLAEAADDAQEVT